MRLYKGQIGMNIDIIAVGKLKEKYLTEGIKEYQKRLSPYCKLRIIEVREQKAPETLSDKQKAQVLKQEGHYILQKMRSSSYVVPLCIEEKSYLPRIWRKTQRIGCFRQITSLSSSAVPWSFR